MHQGIEKLEKGAARTARGMSYTGIRFAPGPNAEASSPAERKYVLQDPAAQTSTPITRGNQTEAPDDEVTLLKAQLEEARKVKLSADQQLLAQAQSQGLALLRSFQAGASLWFGE
jgi:hypothetical protein